MIHRMLRALPLLIVLAIAGKQGNLYAQAHRSPVPPDLEIEVLDPGVDPVGNPAVYLTPDPSNPARQLVDIPPTVLVHRYYYTGDRSFQGPLLPGGPSILVVNHPKSGERCYISAQMLPGAPRVTYSSKCIEYDYGKNGIAVHFGFGGPTIKYRSGLTWKQEIAKLVHFEPVRDHLVECYHHTKIACSRTKTASCGLLVEIKDASGAVTLPLKNTVRLLPFGAALTSGDLEPRLTARALEHQREKAIKHSDRQLEREQFDYRTIR